VQYLLNMITMDFVQVTDFLLTAFFISIGYNEYKTGDRSLPATSGNHLKIHSIPNLFVKIYILLYMNKRVDSLSWTSSVFV